MELRAILRPLQRRPCTSSLMASRPRRQRRKQAALAPPMPFRPKHLYDRYGIPGLFPSFYRTSPSRDTKHTPDAEPSQGLHGLSDVGISTEVPAANEILYVTYYEVSMYACMAVCLFVCLLCKASKSLSVCLSVGLHVWMSACLRVCMYVCTCVRMYVCILSYITVTRKKAQALGQPGCRSIGHGPLACLVDQGLSL